MTEYKLKEGKARLLVAVFEHLKPYYERAKAKHTNVIDEMYTEKIFDTYDALLDRALIAKITEREWPIIKYRYGLSEHRDLHTLEETAREFNLTRERIRQIEASALRKIKQYMTELNDEEADVVIRLLAAKAQEHKGHVVGANLQNDAVSGDVYMHNCIACTNARNKLKIQQAIRKFKEQQ